MPKASYSTIKSILNFLKGNEEHDRKKKKKQILTHQNSSSRTKFDIISRL